MQRYFAKDFDGKNFILDSGDVFHISSVMRMKTGDFIEVVYDSILYKCSVSFNDGFSVLLDSVIDDSKDLEKEIILIIPVLKEQKMDLVLQKATELGVYKIIPVMMERCIVKVNDKENKKLERWTRIVKEASEQCKRKNIPIIDNIRCLDDLIFDDGVKIVCSTVENKKSIKKVMQSNKYYDRMYIVVGPEGGISTLEEQKLNSLGFSSVTLGNRIMRVETVPLYVLSIINYELLE